MMHKLDKGLTLSVCDCSSSVFPPGVLPSLTPSLSCAAKQRFPASRQVLWHCHTVTRTSARDDLLAQSGSASCVGIDVTRQE